MELPRAVVAGLARAGITIGAPGVILVGGIVAIIAINVLTAGGAKAQMTQEMGCGARADIVGELKLTHEETPIAIGVTSVGTVMELWTAREGETWTLLVTLPDGSSCVVGAGQDWISVQRAAKGELS